MAGKAKTHIKFLSLEISLNFRVISKEKTPQRKNKKNKTHISGHKPGKYYKVLEHIGNQEEESECIPV